MEAPEMPAVLTIGHPCRAPSDRQMRAQCRPWTRMVLFQRGSRGCRLWIKQAQMTVRYEHCGWMVDQRGMISVDMGSLQRRLTAVISEASPPLRRWFDCGAEA